MQSEDLGHLHRARVLMQTFFVCMRLHANTSQGTNACKSFVARIQSVSGTPLKGNAIRKGLTFQRALRGANTSQVGEVKSIWTDDAGRISYLPDGGETPLDMA